MPEKFGHSDLLDHFLQSSGKPPAEGLRRIMLVKNNAGESQCWIDTAVRQLIKAGIPVAHDFDVETVDAGSFLINGGNADIVILDHISNEGSVAQDWQKACAGKNAKIIATFGDPAQFISPTQFTKSPSHTIVGHVGLGRYVMANSYLEAISPAMTSNDEFTRKIKAACSRLQARSNRPLIQTFLL